MPNNEIINVQALRAIGYYVEDMGQKWPRAHAGEFRWKNDRCGSLQHHEHRTFNEYDAWADAQRHARANARLAQEA